MFNRKLLQHNILYEYKHFFRNIFTNAVNFEFFISDSKSRIQNTNRCKVVKNLHGEDF